MISFFSKHTKKSICTFIIALTLGGVGEGLLTSCSKEEVDTWSSKSYAWFTNEVTNFSFLDRPDVAEGGTALVAIPFTMAGTVADHDRQVSVEVAQQPADNATSFEIQNPVLIRKGCLSDTLWVKVKNTANLNVKADTVKFRITDGDEILAGLNDKLVTSLALYNGYTQPDWWDSNADRYLGYFTQLKMQIYIAVTGGKEDPLDGKDSWSSNIAVTYTVQRLNDYVDEHNIVYPEGDPHAGQKPQFASRKY